MARLPTEIEGLIISHFRDDTPALRTCSLVNSSWLQQSRRFLFETVIVKSASPSQFRPFLDLLDKARYIRESIQDLTLQAGPLRSWTIWSRNEAIRQGWPAIDRVLLHAIAVRIPKLKRLCLTRVRFTESLNGVENGHQSHSSANPALQLEQLRLSGLGYMPQAEISVMLSSLSAFSQIGELELYHLKTAQSLRPEQAASKDEHQSALEPAGVGADSGYPVPIIRSFKCSTSHATAVELARLVYAMLAQRGDLSALTSLSWAGHDWLALEDMAPFLHATSHRLRSLQLNMGTWVFEGRRDPPGSPRFFDRWDRIIKLTTMPLLESLTMTYDAPPERESHQALYPVFSTYTYLLSHAPPSLRRLTLRFPLPDDEQRWDLTKAEYQRWYLDQLTDKRLLWDELDCALDQIARLETVQVVFSSGWDSMMGRLGPVVVSFMHRMQARNILRVSWRDARYSFQ